MSAKKFLIFMDNEASMELLVKQVTEVKTAILIQISDM
jgi:hypothetical protein